MSTISLARGVVAAMYDGRHWKRKVDQMPDHQVLAIYAKQVQKQAESEKKKAEQDDFGF